MRALRVRPLGESSLRTASGSAVHFGTRAAFRENNPLNCPKRPLPRGAGAFVPPCQLSAVVSATRGESRRQSRRKKSAAVSVLTSSPEICTPRSRPFGRPLRGRGIFDAEALAFKVPRRTCQQTASSSRGGLRPLRGVAARALARYAVCAASIACRLGAFRTALAPDFVGSLRSADSRVML